MKPSDAILIIEDSPEDFEVLEAALMTDSNISNPIQWCKNGEEGLRYLHKQGEFAGQDHGMPVVVLLDLNLPGLDGRDVLARLKGDPHTKRLPVVVMTSSDDQVDIDRCYDEGANSYVVKPVNVDGFLAAITRLREYWFNIVVLPRVE